MKILASKPGLALSVLSLACAALPCYAAAAPALKLSDNNGNAVTVNGDGTVVFGGSCTAATCVATGSTGGVNGNSVSFSGTLGNFNIQAFGKTKPILASPSIDISLQVLYTGVADGTLTAKWSDSGFNASAPYVINGSSNFISGPATVTYTSYADTSNVLFGSPKAVLLGTVGPTSSPGNMSTPFFLGSLGGPASAALSLTNQVTLVMSANSFFFDDFGLSGAPIPPLALACSSSSGQAGAGYSASLVATGGVAPYVYSVIMGALPNGLTLNPTTGLIMGLPSAQGLYGFTVQAKDSSGLSGSNTVTESCNITISPPRTPLSLICAAATGQVGVHYNSALVASGGTGHYSYLISLGSLPAGLTLNNATGFITGIPATAGSFDFTAQVSDTGNTTAAAVKSSCNITITPAPGANCVAINAIKDIAIVPVSLTGTGGAGGPYTFTATGLPAGLVISAAGLISGTPTVSGVFTYTVVIADKNGNKGAFNCSVTVGMPLPLSEQCASGSAQVAITYTSGIAVIGGVAPYIFSVSAGSLPGGLMLNTSTGVISGKPSAAGTFTYTVRVVDSVNNVAFTNCSASCGGGGSVFTVDTSSVLGNLGNSHAYSVNGTSLTAYGFNSNGSATALYAKNSGSTEKGLGIASDGDHEINIWTFIQLDISQLVAAGFTNAQITFNSVQSGESFNVYGSNTLGSLGTRLSGPTTTANSLVPMPGYGVWKYIGVQAASGNVLIGALAFTSQAAKCSITVTPAPLSKIALEKWAGQTKLNPYDKVIYYYKVTNTGTTTVTNILVTDDNGTPGYAKDDFTVGTIATLAPGASATLTATVIPPVTHSGNGGYFDWGWTWWGRDDDGNNFNYDDGKPAGMVICKTLANGNVQFTYRQDRGMVDNTYGNNSSSGWSDQGHKFTDFTGSDSAEFQMMDGNGKVVLDLVADYISASSSYPSGYGTMGVKGGDGGMYAGSSKKILSVDTSMSHNMNQAPSFYGYKTNSPPSGTAGWDFEDSYTITVDGSAFGSAGFGGVKIPVVYNSPCMHNREWSKMYTKPTSSSVTNTGVATGTANGATVTASDTATVQIDASPEGWSKCSKY